MSRTDSALRSLGVPLQRSSLFRSRVHIVMVVFVLPTRDAALVAEDKVPAKRAAEWLRFHYL